jgi:type IX secretion system PorP/SprF family membrane protein
MKKHFFNIVSVAVLLIAANSAFGQQQLMNTQFMYYKLGYNPGYAGSLESPCFTCIFRQQWLGLDGAPAIQALSFNMPLSNQRVGIGANIFRQTIGISSIYNMDAVYAYRVRVGQGALGIGVQTSVRSLNNDFDKTVATDNKSLDPNIPAGAEDKFLFNFGAGLYFNSDQFYFGLSVPRLLENNLDFSSNDVFISREVQHFYLMGGLNLKLSEALTLQPNALIKYVANAPVDLDLNASLVIQNRYIVGTTYRVGGNKVSSVGESLDLLLAAQLTSKLMFGMSFDFSLSDIKDHTTGSVEASLRYCIGQVGGSKEFVNPRFF